MCIAKTKVLFVEDDLDFVYLLKQLLLCEPSISYLGHATNREDAISLANLLHPDIVLMDLCLSKIALDGIDIAKEIRCQTNAKVIILTSFEDPETILHACIKSFASGYIFKNQYDTILQAIKYTASGHTPQEHLIQASILAQLSTAEKTVLTKMLGQDIPLYSSDKTIANQKTSVFKKLGIKNQKEAIHLFEHFILTP